MPGHAVEKTIDWLVVWAAATPMWFYPNDNAAKRDFESQTAYSQFGMDILIRSGIIYYKWPNLKRESLDAFLIWFWTNSQGTGDWDAMTHMRVTIMPRLQNAISQTAESHLGMNNLRSGMIYHKQLRFQSEFGCFLCCDPDAAEQTIERSVITMRCVYSAIWKQRICNPNFQHIVKCITLLLILRVW